MSQQTGNFPRSVWLSREQTRRKVVAFVMTACACFSLIALAWPLTVAGFKTVSNVSVCVGSEDGVREEFQSLLAGVIRSRASDQNLERMVEQVRKETGLENVSLKDVDLGAIRHSISVRALPGVSPNSMQVDIAFQGNGTADERQLVRLLTTELTNGLAELAKYSSAGDGLVIDLDNQGLDDITPVSSNSSRETLAAFEQLDWLVAQIESDLSTVRRSVDSLSASETTSTSNPFRSASHSSSSSAALSGIQQAIEAIDTRTLRDRLQELQTNVFNPMSGAQSLNSGPRLYTRPVGGLPGWGDLFFVGLLSTLISSVVAWHYKPFHASGFENVGRLAAKLQLPLIATIRSGHPTEEPITTALPSVSGWMNQPWANRVVAATKLFLLGMLVFVIGFCLTHQEVRQSFLQNPFLGVCKMVWMFAGY